MVETVPEARLFFLSPYVPYPTLRVLNPLPATLFWVYIFCLVD